MERHEGQLEGEAGDDEQSGHYIVDRWYSALQTVKCRADGAEVERTGLGIEQGHTKQDETRRDRREYEILDARLHGILSGLAAMQRVGDHAVETYTQSLHAQEGGDEMGTTHHYERAQHRNH